MNDLITRRKNLMPDIERNINKEAYTYVDKLVGRIPNQTGSQDLLESDRRKGEPYKLTDERIGDTITRLIDGNERQVELWISHNDEEIGFSNSVFHEFQAFCFDIWEFPDFNKTSCKFIELTVFTWLTNIRRGLISTCELTDYLRAEIIKSTVEKTFYFEIINLDIDHGFNIGDVVISLYDEDKYQEHAQKAKENGLTDSDVESIFGKLRKGVFTSVTVNAEPERGLEIAQEKAELAINVLKLFDSTATFPLHKSRFGLDFKINYQPQLIHFFEVDNSLGISGVNQNDSFKISYQDYENKFKDVFYLISYFITTHKQNELKRIILQSINLYGNAISTCDLHWRGVLMIQVLESIMLKDDQKSDLERKAKIRLSKLIAENDDMKTQIKDDLSHVYQIRHKMLHKARKIQVDLEKFSRAQKHIGSMIMTLVDLREEFETKVELIEHLTKIKS